MQRLEEIADQPIRRAFGARVQELREHAGLTQDQFAERIGKSKDTVQKLEGGRHAAPLPDLFRLAAFFDITIADLLDIADQPSRDSEKRRALRNLIKTVRHEDPHTIDVLRKFHGFMKKHMNRDVW